MMAMLEGTPVRSTNIADLRNHLTRYLKEVRAGEEIVIPARNLPFAKIVPLTHDDEDEDLALVASGLMRRAERVLSASFWRARLPRLSEMLPRMPSVGIGDDN
jgi:prevent-host-death family protein